MILKICIDYSGEDVIDTLKAVKIDDNTGKAKPTRNPPIFAAVAVIADKDTLFELHHKYLASVATHIGNPDDIMSLNNGVLIPSAQFEALHKYELHTQPLIEGKGPWEKIDPHIRARVLDDLLTAIDQADIRYIGIFADFNNQKLAEQWGTWAITFGKSSAKRHILDEAKTALLERVAKEILNKNKAAVILTDGNEEDLKLIKQIKTSGKYMQPLYWRMHLSDLILGIGITDSMLDFGIQLADLFAYSLRRYIGVKRGYIPRILRRPFDTLTGKLERIINSKVIRDSKGIPSGYGIVELKRMWSVL